jgi:hypothetical protein
MFKGDNGWVGIVGTILFIVFAYNILKNFQGAVAVENSSLTGGIGIIKALQGR